MPAADDRWDVVVVALRDPSQAAAVMAIAELAHYASLPPQDIERMLEDDGELPVLQNLDRAEAERAAYEIAELGAVADLRLTVGGGGVFPVFKPDAERQIGVAVGGLIDDSATPPSVGESVGLPELEPDLEAPQAPRGRPSSSGMRAVRASRNTPPPSLEQPAPSRRSAPAAGPPALEDEPPPPPMPRARANTPNSPSAARSNPSGRDPARKPQSSAESLLGDIGPAEPPASPKLPERLQRAVAVAQQAPRELELDFEAAGMAPQAKRGIMVGSPATAGQGEAAERSASDMPRRTRAGNIGGTGASAAGRSQEERGFIDSLRNDGIAALLLGLSVGLVLSLILALQLQRSSARELLPPLEEELAASLNDPSGVAAGKHRAPAAVQSELDTALGDMQRSFLLWWLLPGAGVGLLLSRLRAL